MVQREILPINCTTANQSLSRCESLCAHGANIICYNFYAVNTLAANQQCVLYRTHAIIFKVVFFAISVWLVTCYAIKRPLRLHHLPPGFLSLHKLEPHPRTIPQTPVSDYSWPRRTQVADGFVSPSYFRSPCRVFFSGVHAWLVMTFNYLVLWFRVKGHGLRFG